MVDGSMFLAVRQYSNYHRYLLPAIRYKVSLGLKHYKVQSIESGLSVIALQP